MIVCDLVGLEQRSGLSPLLPFRQFGAKLASCLPARQMDLDQSAAEGAFLFLGGVD